MTDYFPVFRLEKVTHKFNSFTALLDISLCIYPGERVALVGASGAGKSTLLRLLNGTILPSQGQAWLLGSKVKKISPRQLRLVQRKIGTVYQQFHLVDSLRVIHNVNAGHLGRWPFWKAALSLVVPLEVKTAIQALEKVGIPEKLYVRTDRLSGGQQQRVALARVLVQNPEVILADEPISSLDPALSQEIMDLLSQISEEKGKTLVTTLHSLEFAFSHMDRIIGLRAGKIVFDAPVSQVTQGMIKNLYQGSIKAQIPNV